MVELLILYLIVTIVIGKFLHYLTTKPLTKGDCVVILIVANGLAILITVVYGLIKLLL